MFNSACCCCCCCWESKQTAPPADNTGKLHNHHHLQLQEGNEKPAAAHNQFSLPSLSNLFDKVPTRVLNLSDRCLSCSCSTVSIHHNKFPASSRCWLTAVFCTEATL